MKYMQMDPAEIMNIITNKALTHEQAMMQLSAVPLAHMECLTLPDSFHQLKAQGILCDLGEGYAPYAPRYILPDYEKLMGEGCKFLRLAPPKNLFEAITTLEMFYRHIPSITHFPVYLGRIDKMLEPFITDEAEARVLIKSFLIFLDRTISDSYCHANIGPEATRAGELIIALETELQNAIPSITLLYDPEITPDSFAEKCAACALSCAKPSFANHKAYAANHKNYGIASCYNALEIGGGAFTLTRIVLKHAAEQATDQADFFHRVLPEAVDTICAFMEEKIRFLVEESHFFRSSFLVQEGFLHLDRFTGMFGVVGLCECVNILMEQQGSLDRYGHSDAADRLGIKIMDAVESRVNAFHSRWCDCTGHHFALHAQVGIDSDLGVSPGARIVIGEEPPLYEHLSHAGKFHGYFPSGVGDIFPFESTASTNPAAIVDVIKGAFGMGIHYFSTYSDASDVIRITGYLVKRSDIEKLDRGEAVQQDNVVWGLGEVKNSHILDRKVRAL